MAAKDFFDGLESRAAPNDLAEIDYSYVFDIVGEGRWLVEVRDRKVKVTEKWTGGGDVVFSTSSDTFERLASGQQNPMTAYLTGKLKVDGDIKAAMALQQLF